MKSATLIIVYDETIIYQFDCALYQSEEMNWNKVEI